MDFALVEQNPSLNSPLNSPRRLIAPTCFTTS